MARNRAVVLVGPMAVGKSAVGRMLAERIDARFIDTDRLIVEQHGSIAGIFARQGEEAFRTIEADVVRAALAEDAVVSLGGGAVLHPRTRDLLQDATVIFLDTDLATVLPRIGGESGRPLLAGRPAERWQALYDARRPVYAALATTVVDTRGLSVRGVTAAVLRALPALHRSDGPRGGDEAPTATHDTTHDSTYDSTPDLNHESGTRPHGH
ncbi:shikimate kinase [Arthrobacter pityocampae]|uniref:Shikimate kinase n=1 Tax=Arthrobacter pityocampae TaxID=547334 RepID=A0A2S5J0V4_9MICC|nr:shikimate kinase [Arthrobacter pityocampae]PPB50425.1 shikimate kinase [Arthrobacter pityocampae]